MICLMRQSLAATIISSFVKIASGITSVALPLSAKILSSSVSLLLGFCFIADKRPAFVDSLVQRFHCLLPA